MPLHTAHRYDAAPRKLTMKAQNGVKKREEEQCVVLAAVLVDPINYGYQQFTQSQVRALDLMLPLCLARAHVKLRQRSGRWA